MLFSHTAAAPGTAGFAAAALLEGRTALAFFTGFLLWVQDFGSQAQYRYYCQQEQQIAHTLPPYWFPCPHPLQPPQWPLQVLLSGHPMHFLPFFFSL